MKVLVMGAGVIGVATAYYLSRQGIDVTVVDRQPGPAVETSFANAGQVSPGYSTPWAAPGVPLKAIKWMLQKHAPLAVRLDGSLFQLQWMWQMLMNCNMDAYKINKSRMMRLAEYSRDCLRALRQETGIQYEERASGTLQLFRSPVQYAAAERDIRVLREMGVAYELLQSDQLSKAEPALAGRCDLAGGLRLPNDETGDCHLFTTRLAQLASMQNVKFCFNSHIGGFRIEGGSVCGVQVNGQEFCADRYVLALGSYSRNMLYELGIRLPVYPVKGFSLTVPIRDAAKSPISTVLDETYKVAVTRFDNRIRVGGMAEVAGFDLRLNPKRRETLAFVVENLFPGAGDVSNASFWTGLRPMTPDGTPIVGESRLKNLYLNTGHGTLGWTMACGSGRLITDKILGRSTDIESSDLSINRYQMS